MKRKGRTWRGKAKVKGKKGGRDSFGEKDTFFPSFSRRWPFTIDPNIPDVSSIANFEGKKSISRILFLSSYANKDDLDDETKFPF